MVGNGPAYPPTRGAPASPSKNVNHMILSTSQPRPRPAQLCPSPAVNRTRVLAELGDLRERVDAFNAEAVSKESSIQRLEEALATANLRLLQSQQAEELARHEVQTLQKRVQILEDSSQLAAQLERMRDENAMVLDYLEKAIEENKQHKATNAELLQLQTEQSQRVAELEAQLADARAATNKSRQQAEEGQQREQQLERRAQTAEERCLQLQHGKQVVEQQLGTARREYHELQQVQEELLQSIQDAQDELQQLRYQNRGLQTSEQFYRQQVSLLHQQQELWKGTTTTSNCLSCGAGERAGTDPDACTRGEIVFNESLQRSLELSEARNKLLQATLSLYEKGTTQ
eukprot:TRINITY_DN2238_c0_g1_i1.p1 TRINITY_DN2238_c0_g1~~TRINITY_DN2238_c0_g1_i1.p1  ORF type:complete len:351 (+),score=85.37 TRINITY_DN2238_c0_g1_i1:24-1055(+)